MSRIICGSIEEAHPRGTLYHPRVVRSTSEQTGGYPQVGQGEKMNERSGADVILPPSWELFVGAVVFVAAVLAMAVLLAVDLRRRDVAAWWVVGALGVVVLPVGWTGWAVLRVEEWRSERQRGSTG